MGKKKTMKSLPIWGLDSLPFSLNITNATRFPINNSLSLCVYATKPIGEAHLRHDAL
jgi:hypothetical protein